MNTIKIYFDESGSTLDLKKDFRLYQGQYQSKLLNVYVPTSILAPDFESHDYIENESQDLNQHIGATIGEYLTTTAVKIGMASLARDGKIKVSRNYYMKYLKTLTYQGVEYALYERKLPKEFTMYAGVGANAPRLIANVVNIQQAQYAEADNVTAETVGTYYVRQTVENTTYYIYKAVTLPADYDESETYYTQTQEAQVLDITTTQECALDVMPSKDLENDEVVEPSDLEIITGELNEIYEILPTKQDKEDQTINYTTDESENVTWQNSKTVVGAINNNTTQNETNRQNIATNTLDIAQNRNDIDVLQESMLSYENYIGQLTGSELPTQTELTTFTETQTSRAPKNGDVIIFILQIAGSTDKNYKYFYTLSGWQGYEIPPMESASNGSLGLVKGTYTIGASADTLVDISGGAILNIYVKDASNNYRNIVEYLNTTTGNISNIIDGTTPVAKALRAVSDELGNDIVETYMTKQYGATKQYVKDYAMPKEFNEINYISSEGFVSAPPTEPASGIQFTTNTSAIGDFTIFQLSKTNDAEFSLSSKNGYADTIYVSASADCDVYFRMTTQYKKPSENWVTMAVELTPLVELTANEIAKVDFESLFTSLNENIVNMTEGDLIRQTLEVVTETSSALTFNLYSNATYPSRFYFESIIYVVDPVSVDDVQFTYQSTDASGNNIYSATTTLTDGNTINSGTITAPKGATGSTGATGVGISTITAGTPTISGGTTSTPVTVNLTSGSPQVFNVVAQNGANGSNGTNGSNGADGASVTNVQVTFDRTDQDGNNVYNVTTTVGTNTTINSGTITAPKGGKGDTGNTGATGVGISSITAGTPTQSGTTTVTPVTVTLTNTNAQTFTVTAENGQDGATGATGVGVQSVAAGTPYVSGTKTITPITFTFTNTNQITVNVEAENGSGGGSANIYLHRIAIFYSGSGKYYEMNLNIYNTSSTEISWSNNNVTSFFTGLNGVDLNSSGYITDNGIFQQSINAVSYDSSENELVLKGVYMSSSFNQYGGQRISLGVISISDLVTQM